MRELLTTQSQAGTYHFIALDEPPPEAVWGEVQPRLRHHRGHLRCVFTNPKDFPWMRKMVTDG